VTPFAVGRDGYLLAEGSAIVVIEELEHALKRGAHIYGELVGFGSSADAYDSYKLQPSGKGMSKSMEFAIKDADITPYDIDYICAHGSGSHGGDIKESNAIKLLFGERAKHIPVSTIKEIMGMPFGASTGFQLIASLLMLENQKVIPIMNLDQIDPECAGPDYVINEPRDAELDYALMNSMGLGGNNATIIVKKFKR